MKEKRKVFKVDKGDGSIAEITFTKPKGSIWYWDLPHTTPKEEKETSGIRSLPLPDVELDNVKCLRDALDLIAAKRGTDWVGQVIIDCLKC